ncbi:hypothetical protein J0H58_28275 [bacterium]|nr:hypothetical protein [bacterium]
MITPALGPSTSVSLPTETPPLNREDRAYLSRAASAIRGRLKSAAHNMIATGKLLLQARRRLRRDGRFVAWLQSNHGPGVTRMTAYRLMAVAEAFGGLPSGALRNIPKGTLYALSQAGVPQSLREFVVQEAKDGRTITQTEVLQWIEEQRKPVEGLKSYKAAPSPERPKADPAAAHAADNWLALGVLLQPGVMIHVNHAADEENGEKTVSVTVYDTKGVRSTTRPTLEDAVVELAGLKRMRVCRACLEPKRLDEFSRLKGSPEERNRACLQCERERVAEAPRAKSVSQLGNA